MCGNMEFPHPRPHIDVHTIIPYVWELPHPRPLHDMAHTVPLHTKQKQSKNSPGKHDLIRSQSAQWPLAVCSLRQGLLMSQRGTRGGWRGWEEMRERGTKRGREQRRDQEMESRRNIMSHSISNILLHVRYDVDCYAQGLYRMELSRQEKKGRVKIGGEKRTYEGLQRNCPPQFQRKERESGR